MKVKIMRFHNVALRALASILGQHAGAGGLAMGVGARWRARFGDSPGCTGAAEEVFLRLAADRMEP